MQVLNTTSPLTPSGPSAAPNSVPSNTAPDSSASRPLTSSGTQHLQVAGRSQRGLIDVGDLPLRQGEQHATAQRGVQQRRVAGQGAELLDADRPLLVRVEEHAVGDLAG